VAQNQPIKLASNRALMRQANFSLRAPRTISGVGEASRQSGLVSDKGALRLS
jgi:hypothetical protein